MQSDFMEFLSNFYQWKAFKNKEFGEFELTKSNVF